MFRLGAKPPTNQISKQSSGDVGGHDENIKSNAKSRPIRSSSEPSLINMTPNKTRAPKKEYANDFKDKGGFENQSVEELQNYAAYKAEDTTNTVKNCLRIAEDIKDQGEQTLVTLQQQGEQINRTHNQVVNIDHDLSRVCVFLLHLVFNFITYHLHWSGWLSQGEKILGSLGGMFSATWKPKKSHTIKGPAAQADSSSNKKTKGNDSEQRDKLGLNSKNPGKKYAEPSSAMEKVEVNKHIYNTWLGYWIFLLCIHTAYVWF